MFGGLARGMAGMGGGGGQIRPNPQIQGAMGIMSRARGLGLGPSAAMASPLRPLRGPGMMRSVNGPIGPSMGPGMNIPRGDMGLPQKQFPFPQKQFPFPEGRPNPVDPGGEMNRPPMDFPPSKTWQGAPGLQGGNPQMPTELPIGNQWMRQQPIQPENKLFGSSAIGPRMGGGMMRPFGR